MSLHSMLGSVWNVHYFYFMDEKTLAQKVTEMWKATTW